MKTGDLVLLTKSSLLCRVIEVDPDGFLVVEGRRDNGKRWTNIYSPAELALV